MSGGVRGTEGEGETVNNQQRRAWYSVIDTKMDDLETIASGVESVRSGKPSTLIRQAIEELRLESEEMRRQIRANPQDS